MTRQPTIIFTPAAKLLIQVKRRRAMPQLNVGQPLGNNVQKGGIQANRCANDSDDDPALRSVIRSP
jgi:hypothetical protein